MVVVLLLGGGAAAQAAAPAADFAPHVQQAQTCYDAKDFDCAVRELQAAYDIKKLPGLLLNIGHAHLDAGRPQEALTFYGMYLQSEKKLTPTIRAEVEKFRAQARERMKEAPPPGPNNPAGTDPSLNPNQTANPSGGAIPAGTPEPPAVTTPPPEVVTAPEPAATSTVARPSRVPAGGLALMGVGAGLLIVGAGLGGGAVATAGQVTSSAGPFDTALDSRGRTMSYAGVAFDVVGALALVGGLGWTISWAVGRNKEKASAPAAVSVRPGLAGAVVLGRF